MTGTTEGGKKTAEGGRGSPETASPAAVEKYLHGANYPLEKQELMDLAKKNNATEDVLRVIEKLSEKTYHSPIDISKEIGNIGQRSEGGPGGRGEQGDNRRFGGQGDSEQDRRSGRSNGSSRSGQGSNEQDGRSGRSNGSNRSGQGSNEPNRNGGHSGGRSSNRNE